MHHQRWGFSIADLIAGVRSILHLVQGEATERVLPDSLGHWLVLSATARTRNGRDSLNAIAVHTLRRITVRLCIMLTASTVLAQWDDPCSLVYPADSSCCARAVG